MARSVAMGGSVGWKRCCEGRRAIGDVEVMVDEVEGEESKSGILMNAEEEKSKQVVSVETKIEEIRLRYQMIRSFGQD